MSGLIAKAGGDEELMEAGNYVARCVQVIDHGTQYNERYDNHNHKVLLGFEFPTEMKKVGDEERPWLQWKQYTLSLGDRANLRKDLASWRGRDFTPEELQGFDLCTILGAPAMVTVQQYTGNDNIVRNGLGAIAPVPKGMEVPPQITESVKFLLNDFDQTVFDTFSEHHQEKIKKSKEYQALCGEPASDMIRAVAESDKAEKKDTSVKRIDGFPKPPPTADDDIPF